MVLLFRARLAEILRIAHILNRAVGVSEEGADGVGVGLPILIQGPCAVGGKCKAVTVAFGLCRQLQAIFAVGPIAGEGIAGHLLGKLCLCFGVFCSKDKVDARRQVPTCSVLVVVAVAEIGDLAAVIVGGAKAAARLAGISVEADVGEVVAAVGAALLLFPIDHADGSHVRVGDPVAVVDNPAQSADTAGVGICGLGPIFHNGIGIVFGLSHLVETGQLQFLHFLVGLLLRTGGTRLVIVQTHRSGKGMGTAVEVIALGHAAQIRGEAVDVRARHRSQRRGAVAVPNNAPVLARKAGDHSAAADLRQLDAADGVALADLAAAVVHTHQTAGTIAPGIGAGAGDAGNIGAACLDQALVAPHQTAEVVGAAAVGAAGQPVAGNGAIFDRAAVFTGQYACIHRFPLDIAAQFGGGGVFQRFHRCHDDVLQRSCCKAEQADGMAVLPAGKGNAGDDMAAAVIAVLKGGVFCLSDGSLLSDCFPALAVVLPVIGVVIDAPLLLEGSIFVQNLLVGVFVVIFTQGVQLPRRADADQLRCSGFGRQRSLGKMGVVVVCLARRAAYRQLRVEAVRDISDILHQIRRQGQQVVGLCRTILVGDLNGDLVLRFQFIGLAVNRHLHVFLRLGFVDHAVAVAQHRFVGQRLNVGAEEAVVGPTVPLVVHQCAVFKLRLPVAVMGQVFQLGIGVQRQAQTFHQVVGIGIAVLSGEVIIRRARSEQLFHCILGAQVTIIYRCTDGGFRRIAEIIDVFHFGSGAVFTSRSIR